MDSKRPDLSSLTERLMAGVPEVSWETPADLGRMSVEAMASMTPGLRRPKATGSMRLFGEGVEGHSASMLAVGQLMSQWQKLVSAVAGASQGHKGIRGRLPASIENAATLWLEASPLPGSLLLTFTPQMDPGEELTEDDVLPAFEQPDTQLVDEAISTTLTLITHGAQAGPDLDEDGVWVGELAELGPRTASALAGFARIASTADFDMDLDWAQPHKPTRRARMTSSEAAWMVSAIGARELDEARETITGRIVTITDRATIHVETSPDEIISIRPGKLDHDDFVGIEHGSDVSIDVLVEIRALPGEEPRSIYTAEAIRGTATETRTMLRDF